MGLEVKVLQTYNGYSQIEASSKTAGSVYYSVPAKNANRFGKDLKQHAKNSNLYACTALGVSAVAGVLGAAAITKNMNKIADIAAKIIAGTVLAGISGYFVNDYNNKQYDKLIHKYRAKELQSI